MTGDDSMKKSSECLIIGGGIIGLGVAYELAVRGVSVTLIEQGEWGGQASSAAAGMLAPLKEFASPGPLLDMGMESLRLYPEWVRRIEEESGLHVDLEQSGLLTVACTDEERERLWQKYQWQTAAGIALEWLEEREARNREPLLSPHLTAALYSPEEGHVNNVQLLQALVRACQARGVQLLQGVSVTGFLRDQDKVCGVRTSKGDCFASHTVVTAGAWSGLLAEELGLSLPIRPVRGQICAVSSDHAQTRHIIFGSSGYAVRKRDGRIVLGATEDEAGFCGDVTAGGLLGVLQGVLALLPSLANARFLQAWAGLRPATADGLPIIGPVPGWQGVTLAFGHFRNGILLAPATAKRVATLLLSGDAALLEPFRPDRFVP